MMDREMDTLPQENQSLESSHNSGGFDCNICLELAQEPVVTMCGHLYCWPCLYTWLHMNNMPKECPVCKAFVNEEKLVPLYGRGKIEEVTDTRPKSVMQVPSRPSGHRTQVASSRPTNNTHHPPPHQSFNFMPNQAMGSFGNVSFSGFGLFPYLFGFQMHAAPAHSPYATSTSGFHHNHDHHHHGTHRFFQQVRQEQQQETFLSRLLLFLGCLVVACLLFF